MKRSLTLRLFMGTLVIVFGMIAFSYAHARSSRQDNPATNGEGKCEAGKSQSPFVLWESLTRNLLISRR
jgi:hypothetical protein